MSCIIVNKSSSYGVSDRAESETDRQTDRQTETERVCCFPTCYSVKVYCFLFVMVYIRGASKKFDDFLNNFYNCRHDDLLSIFIG